MSTPEWSEPRACVEIRCRQAREQGAAAERARLLDLLRTTDALPDGWGKVAAAWLAGTDDPPVVAR